MSIELKEHNKVAYEKVKEMFKFVKRAAVIHPTGTGKSYIGLKLVEENPEDQVLYLAPSNSILHQIKSTAIKSNGKMFKNLKRMTYSKLSKLSEEELKKLNPKYIILDEFHHCGAPVWGEAVQKLIENNPNSSVLGLSATPIRYFDGNIDMAEELFAGCIASEISFEEAIENGILPEFDYVSALYGYKSSLKALEEQINSSTVAVSKKNEAKILYNQLKAQLNEDMEELPEILGKHMENKNGKYLIFCRNIEDMEQKIAEAQKVFSKVNPNIKIYRVSSSETDMRKNEKTLTEFENDDSENTLKLMFSVNMLNEGYHIPDIDAVIMMRPTQSPTIYAQQMGRALSVGNNKKPKIIDLVDNFDTIRIIENFSEKMKEYKKSGKQAQQEDLNPKSKVVIYDYLKDASKIISKIEKLTKRKSLTIEQKIDLFEKFINDENTDERIIQSTVYEGYPIGVMVAQIRRELKSGIHNYSPDEVERMKNLGLLEDKIRSFIGEKISILEEFCKNHSELWFLKNNGDDINEYLAKIENKEERIRLLEQLKIAESEYAYLRTRNSKGKISEENFKRLREAGVGGVFGYKKEIIELSEKYAISSSFRSKQEDYKSQEEYEKAKEEHIKRFQRYLYKIDMQYGGINNFRKSYVQSMLKGKRPNGTNFGDIDLYVTTFDLGEKDFIARPDKNIYYKILSDFTEGKRLDTIFFNSIIFKEKIEEYLNTIPEKDAQTFRLVYGLQDGIPRTYAEVGRMQSVTGSTIGMRIARIERRIFKQLKGAIIELDADRQKEFIEKYFKHNDIFIEPEAVELNETLRQELLDIINIGAIEQEKRAQQMSLYKRKEKKEISEFLKEIYGDSIEVDKLKFLPIRVRAEYEDDAIIDLERLMNDWYYARFDVEEAVLKQALEDINIDVNYDFYEKSINVINNGNVEITELGFSEKVVSSLKKAGITKLYNLLSLTEEQLNSIEEVSSKERYEIIFKLNYLGLDINMETEMIIDKTVSTKIIDNTILKSIQEEFSSDDIKQILSDMHIDELDFSVRTYNCLNKTSIKNVYDLIRLSDYELKTIRNLGKSSYEEIIEKIEAMGLSFYDEDKTEKENEEILKEQVLRLIEKSSNEKVENDEDSKLTFERSILMLPIEELDLSIRTFNCLARAGIRKVYDLTRLTEEELMKVRNLGKHSYDEVIEKIQSMGLSFNGSVSQEHQDLVDDTFYNLTLFKRKKEALSLVKYKKVKKLEQLQELLEAKKQNSQYFDGEQVTDTEIQKLSEKFLGTKGMKKLDE